MDIPSFLRLYPPFDGLDDDQLAGIVRHTHIEFHPVGDVILQQGGAPAHHLFVIRTGAVEMIDDGQVLDLLSEGEVFGHTSLLSGIAPTFSVRAHEDSILYLIDEAPAVEILGTRPGLGFLSSSLRQRVVRALEGIDHGTADPWQTHVGALVRRPPVEAPATLPIGVAAGIMTRERVSSLLIRGDGEPSIVTDRDLRSRVVATGLDLDAPIGRIASSPLVTAPASWMVAEVVALMLERGVHHVPITEDDGTIVGMVTDTDLMGLEQKTPFALKAEIERATTADDAITAGRRLPEAVCTLVEANVDPISVGHMIGVTTDTLTRQLLELGIVELGDPPCPWSWLALGSEARLEQALVTDQDNALVIDPGDLTMASVDPYFERLASYVNDGIEAAGIPKCHAGVIASNPLWRDTPSGWEERFRRGIELGDWSGGVLGAIGLDLRPVAGSLEVRPMFDGIIRLASRHEHFIRRLATTTVKERPPTGFTRTAVIHLKGRTDERLDVKHGGITLITSLARVYAIMGGLSENRTDRRLVAANELDLIEDDTMLGLIEAFRLLWQTRLEHQVGQVRAGLPPDDLVDPRSLGPLGRQGLKQAFKMIARTQDIVAARLGLRR